MSNYPFKNLVFEGGGAKGIAYLGMLEELDARGILGQIERVAGASVGAVTATIVSFSSSFSEMKTVADSIEYPRLLDTGCIDLRKSRLLPRLLREKLGGIIGDLCCVYRLLKRYGWYSSEYFYRWLRGKIEEKFTLGKDKYTFADFKAEGFPGLYVVGADVSSHCTRVFSAESTPDVEVALAVRISMSIPLFFESIKFDYPGLGQAHIFADGGTMRNYPITMFDDPQYDHGGNFIGDVNVETLGGYLYTPESCENKKPVTNLVSYAENLFISLLDVQHDMYENNPDSKERSIEIDDQCVSPTDFHIRVGDEIYDELYKAGKTATKHYLDEYGKA